MIHPIDDDSRFSFYTLRDDESTKYILCFYIINQFVKDIATVVANRFMCLWCVKHPRRQQSCTSDERERERLPRAKSFSNRNLNFKCLGGISTHAVRRSTKNKENRGKKRIEKRKERVPVDDENGIWDTWGKGGESPRVPGYGQY